MMVHQIAEKLTVTDIQDSSVQKSNASEEWVQGSGVSEVITQLTAKHQPQILAGLLPLPRILANCKSFDIPPASLMLNYPAQSAGIMKYSTLIAGQFYPFTPLSESSRTSQELSKLTQDCQISDSHLTAEHEAHIDWGAVVVAQPTADLEGLGTLCSINEKSLTPENETHIAGRGLLNDWARACCHSASIAQASFYLGYAVKSAGILFMGSNGQVQFRPDNPEPKKGKKKPLKYLSPSGEFDALLPPSPDNPLYWEIEALKREAFYINDVPYILLTEGVFKALAGCSNGIPTISLLGAEQGLTGKARDPENQRFLVPALRKLAEAGFGFIIAFDADAATNPNVRAAERKLAKQLAKFNVPVRSITGCWEAGPNGEFKGMDDFIQNKGIEEFRAILIKAKLFGEKEGDADVEKKRKFPSADAMSRQIAEDYRNKLAFNNEVLCWYRYEADTPGVWSPETDEYTESFIYHIIKSKGLTDIPPTYVPSVKRFLRDQLMERKWQSKAGLLPFENGVLEIATGKLHPHSPSYKFTWTLPRPHSIIDTQWGKIRNWLDFATHGNAHLQNLLLAFAAATLKGRADIQKFLHLIGIGGSGKGTFIRLLIALIGLENCHSSTLEDWCSNRFEAAQAYGKRLLIFPDENRGTRSLGKFKQVTGGDWLRAEEKGQKPFKFKFEGMVAVASEFPIFGADSGSGMARRTISVPFSAAVGARRDLDKEFMPELAAFTNYLLSLDDAWVENTLRGVMDIPEIGAQFWESKIREDSIAGFLNDKLILDPLAQTSIGDSPNAEGTLYQAYHQYCTDQGHKPQAVKNFSPNLIECAGTILGWQIEKAHTKIGKIIKGLRLRTKGDEHIPTYDYELQSRCAKPGDGFGDGSVTDKVTGQNPYPDPITALVTDKPLTQGGENIQIPAEIKEATVEVNQESISNASDNVDKEVSVNPSPSAEPLPAANPDPSPHPSPHPSPKFKTGDRVQVQSATDLNDNEVELVEFIHTALKNDDVEFAGMIQEILQDSCKESVTADRGKVWAALTKEEQSAFRALLAQIEINPTDAEKMREIASIWWQEYYPQDMQSLIAQMFGWGAPGRKYISYAIKRWLKSEKVQTQERIGKLLDLKENSPQP